MHFFFERYPDLHWGHSSSSLCLWLFYCDYCWTNKVLIKRLVERTYLKRCILIWSSFKCEVWFALVTAELFKLWLYFQKGLWKQYFRRWFEHATLCTLCSSECWYYLFKYLLFHLFFKFMFAANAVYIVSLAEYKLFRSCV